MTYTFWLILLNFIVFFAQIIATQTGIDIIKTPTGNPLTPVCPPSNTGCDAVADILALNPRYLITRMYFWQIFTYMFVHGDFLHIFYNMFGLMVFGPRIEFRMGSNKFLKYYFLCGIGSSLFYILITAATTGLSNVPMLGASGAIFGILTAYGLMYPRDIIYVQFFFPMPAILFVILYGMMQLLLGIATLGAHGGVAYFGHLGGMIVGFILIKFFNFGKKVVYFWEELY